jgi:hypothetical protein
VENLFIDGLVSIFESEEIAGSCVEGGLWKMTSAPIYDGFTEDDSNEEQALVLWRGAGFKEDMKKQQ